MNIKEKRQLALSLRLEGKSYSEIQAIISVSKSTLSEWLSGIVLSGSIKERLSRRTQKNSLQALIKRNKQQTTLAQARAKLEQEIGSNQIRHLSARDIGLIGIALYWAEGHKRLLNRNGRDVTYHPISLSNADPKLIKIFIRFLQEYLSVPIEKIKAELRAFPHQNHEELITFWQEQTGIPSTNFTKIYTGVSRASLGKRPFQRLPYGILQIRVADTKLFHRLIGSIEGMQKFV